MRSTGWPTPHEISPAAMAMRIRVPVWLAYRWQTVMRLTLTVLLKGGGALFLERGVAP